MSLCEEVFMLFNSYEFLIFFPIVILIFYIIPKKIRYIWLLISSYYFYMCWSPKYAILIAFSTIITYFSGLLIEKAENSIKLKKCIVGGCVGINLAILFFFKYFTWLLDNLNSIFHNSLSTPFTIILPIGISFYTFQALGYTIDVYRGDIKAERNILKYALFVSFFPQLVSGPIGRSKNLLNQFDCSAPFQYQNVRKGLLLMLWGFFEKMVIADKLGIMVDSVFNNPWNYYGSTIVLATILFAFQLYCDFGGYSHIAIGAAQVLNINLMNNFKQPYFSTSIKDFWRRWHISLSTWFRDYLYIPLGGNRCSKSRKFFNLFFTFLMSGLWHGANWHYMIWGGIHGIYQILGEISAPVRKKIMSISHVKTDCFSFHLFRCFINFVLIDFAWLFFRANSLSDAYFMCKQIILLFHPSEVVSEVIWTLGLNGIQLGSLVIALLILLFVDILHEKNISISAFLEKQNLLFRWGIYYITIFYVIFSIIQSFGEPASSFIYFQF